MNLHNHKFGNLTALYRLHNIKVSNVKWLCICDCGNITEVFQGNLTRGNTTSCGCNHIKAVSTHGMNRTRLYNIFDNMKARCYHKNTLYAYHTGKDIYALINSVATNDDKNTLLDDEQASN